LQVTGGAFKNGPDQLEKSAAGQLLSAGKDAACIGPVLGLVGYAIKQWSSCQQVPATAVDLLQGYRDLVADLQAAWPFISGDDNQERLQRWLDEVTAAALQSVDAAAAGNVNRSARHGRLLLLIMSCVGSSQPWPCCGDSPFVSLVIDTSSDRDKLTLFSCETGSDEAHPLDFSSVLFAAASIALSSLVVMPHHAADISPSVCC
jgi:hypothetical protein